MLIAWQLTRPDVSYYRSATGLSANLLMMVKCCRLPGVFSDDLDELGSMLEVTVQDRSERCGTEADVVRLVKGTAAQLQQRLKELHRLLKEK